jgi:hypothetical protein
VATAEDKQPVETLDANGTNEALGVSVGLWRANRRVDDRDSFAAEDLVEGGGEFSIAVVDQEPRPLEETGEAKVARLLGDPGAGRIARAAGEMDTAAAKLDVGSAGGASAVRLCRLARFPPAATSIRACGSPAHGSPTFFTAGIRLAPPGPAGPGCDDSSSERDQAQPAR